MASWAEQTLDESATWREARNAAQSIWAGPGAWPPKQAALLQLAAAVGSNPEEAMDAVLCCGVSPVVDAIMALLVVERPELLDCKTQAADLLAAVCCHPQCRCAELELSQWVWMCLHVPWLCSLHSCTARPASSCRRCCPAPAPSSPCRTPRIAPPTIVTMARTPEPRYAA